jgi:glutathione synthase/RimK-type ligase-like ATP-grasp enzyme
MILLIRDRDNPTADYIESRLRERGQAIARFYPEAYPVEAAFTVDYSARGERRVRLTGEDGATDLAGLTAVWFKQIQTPRVHDEIADPNTRRFVEHECQTILFDLWHTLDCLWMPGPPSALSTGQYKIRQLRIAAEVGFELPPTLVTTNPDEVLAFYQEQNGQVVSKLVGTMSSRYIARDAVRYTEPVTPRDLGYVDAIRFCPIFIQAYVPKRVELRVTVVGRQVFAAEIQSQGNNRTRHDWRHYDHYRTTHRAHELPPDIQLSCLRLVERLGLCYGALDLILTPDGRYVFLEINPGGQYLWIEFATGLPITDAICDLLISGEERGMTAAEPANFVAGGIS